MGAEIQLGHRCFRALFRFFFGRGRSYEHRNRLVFFLLAQSVKLGQLRLDLFQIRTFRRLTAHPLSHLQSDLILLVFLEQAFLKLGLIRVFLQVLQQNFDRSQISVLDRHMQRRIILVPTLVLNIGLVLQQQ